MSNVRTYPLLLDEDIKNVLEKHNITAENAIDFIEAQMNEAFEKSDATLFATTEKLIYHLIEIKIITKGLLYRLSPLLMNPSLSTPLASLLSQLIISSSTAAFEEAVITMYELLVHLHNENHANYESIQAQLFDWLGKALSQGLRIPQDALPCLFDTTFCLKRMPFRSVMVASLLKTHVFDKKILERSLQKAIDSLDKESCDKLIQHGVIPTERHLTLAVKKVVDFKDNSAIGIPAEILACCAEHATTDISAIFAVVLKLAEELKSVPVIFEVIRKVIHSKGLNPSVEEHTQQILLLISLCKEGKFPPDLVETLFSLNKDTMTHSKYRFHLLGLIATFPNPKYKTLLVKAYEFDIDFINLAFSEKRDLVFRAINQLGNQLLIKKILASNPDFINKLTSSETLELFIASIIFDYAFVRSYIPRSPEMLKEIEGHLFCLIISGKQFEIKFHETKELEFLIQQGFIQKNSRDAILIQEDWLSPTFFKLMEKIKDNLLEAVLYYRVQVENYLRNKKIAFFPQMSQGIFFSLMHLALINSDVSKLVAEAVKLESIHLGNMGKSSETWTSLTRGILNRIAGEISTPSDHTPKLLPTEKRLPRKNITEFEKVGWKFLRHQGRTILFEHHQTKKWLAIKVKKEEESIETLEREYETVAYFKKHKKELSIKSKLPNPWGLFEITGLKNAAVIAYIYEVDNDHHDYFTYLHDKAFSQQEFALANRIAVHDLYHLLRQGFVYHQLADIFHDNEEIASKRPDKGRYYALTNLLTFRLHGNGEVMNWQQAVAYVNIRMGLADLGDWMALSEFFNFNAFTRDHYNVLFRDHCSVKEKSWLLYANTIAEYHLVLELCAGRRALASNYSSAGWINIAKLLVSNAAYAIAILTNSPEYQAQNFLESWINIPRYAEQLSCAMTGKWRTYLSNGFPAAFYGADVKVTVNYENIKHKELLPSMLGSYSGQYPIKEGEKLRYAMIIAIATRLGYKKQTEKEQKNEKTIEYKYFSLWRDKTYQRKLVAQTCGENAYFPALRH